MSKIKSTYYSKIVKALKSSGLYSPNLAITIDNLAGALWVKYLCEVEMDSPDFKVTVMKITRDGEQPIEAPVLKTYSRASDQVTAYMKALNLTVEDIVGKPEIENGVDIMRSKVNAVE